MAFGRCISIKYPNLFSPGKIGTLTLRNRTIMTAMGVAMANADGTASDQLIAYYGERAQGGVGLIVTEYTKVSDLGAGTLLQSAIGDDRYIPGLQKLCQTVQRHGAKIFIQLHHAGRQTYRALIGGVPVVAPSAIPCGRCQQETHALTLAEVKEIEEQFIAAAGRAKRAGADGVEVHCSHGYLLQQFLSPYTNHRTDAYGGSVENRTRIVVEIIRGIKALCGADYPVSVRVTAEEYLAEIGKPEEGLHVEEAVEICKALEAAGADALNVSCGLYETIKTFIEPCGYKQGWRLSLVETVKRAVSIPVFGNAVIRDPDYAEELLQKGSMDFISMGRTFLADPEWPNKAFSGREKEIRKCLSCLRCTETFGASVQTKLPLQCSLNPRLGREAAYPKLVKQDGAGRVVAVVGAGAAGMQAAITLAQRNFHPILFDKNSRLGGQLLQAKLPPDKERIDEFLCCMEQELKKLKVDVRLNTEVTSDLLRQLHPEAVAIATGSIPFAPKSIPGVDGSQVCMVSDILTGRIKPHGKKVVVVGSGMTGLETAEVLIQNDNRVCIVEMADTVGPGGYIVNVMEAVKHLKQKNTQFLLGHKLSCIKENAVVLERKDGQLVEEEAQLVVLALGMRPENTLYQSIKEQNPNCAVLGDAVQIGHISDAVFAGYEYGYHLFG